jgi:hypothetical protein
VPELDPELGRMSFILQHCPSLIHLNLTVYYDTYPREIPHIVHQHLEPLDLNITSPMDWDGFFEPYTLPSLRRLTTKCDYWAIDHWFFGAIISLIDRSKCTIETLIVDEIYGGGVQNIYGDIYPLFC